MDDSDFKCSRTTKKLNGFFPTCYKIQSSPVISKSLAIEDKKLTLNYQNTKRKRFKKMWMSDKECHT